MATSLLFVGAFVPDRFGSLGVCQQLAMRLRAKGWQVCLTSSRDTRAARFADVVSTIWLRRREYAVAHVDVFSGPAFIWAEAACWMLRRCGKPYVLTLHGGNLPRWAARWPGRARRLLRSAQVVTCPSDYLRREMRPFRDDLTLVPNAVDVESYPFVNRAKPRPRLVWLRAFHHIYNPELAVRVVGLLREHRPDVQLTMFGPDKRDGSLTRVQAMVREMGLESHVTLRGPVSKACVPLVLSAGDVFLNTTMADNSPVSVLEAMACGLPVVSTNVGGMADLVADQSNGLLVPPGDPASMASAVRRILEDGCLASRLSRCGRETAVRLDWEPVVARWQQVFETVGQHTALQ